MMTPTQTVMGIRLPADDTHFPDMIRKGPMLAGKGTYQLNKLEAALPYVKRKGIAVDVGAHVGLWTRVLATQFKWVHAFEMMERHIACLEVNCEGQANVIVHGPVALGSGKGLTSAVVEKENSGNTRVAPKTRPSSYDVMMEPLDSFLPDHSVVDFLKIDVEGYEMQVVIGATGIIKASHPVMVVEQKPGNAERYGNRTGEVIELLKAWGARIVWQRSGDFCLAWE